MTEMDVKKPQKYTNDLKAGFQGGLDDVECLVGSYLV